MASGFVYLGGMKGMIIRCLSISPIPFPFNNLKIQTLTIRLSTHS